MAIQDLSPGTKQLLEGHIDSVIQMEMLLMLKVQPDTPLSAAHIAQQLYVSEAVAGERLAALERSGLLQAEVDADGRSCYRYRPANPAMDAQVEDLARDYAQRRVRVIEWLYSRPSSSVRSFAGAFRLRRRDES